MLLTRKGRTDQQAHPRFSTSLANSLSRALPTMDRRTFLKRSGIGVGAGVAVAAMLMAGAALAKLPPPSDETKAKIEETKSRTDWSSKVAAYQLCLVQDKVAANYRKAKGRDARPASAAFVVPPCHDPGPYAAQPPEKPAPPVPG